MGSFNTVTAPISNTITVNFPSAGSYSYEVDYADSNQAALIPAASTWKYKIANATLGAITAISRTNGVVTVTVSSALNDLAVGNAVAIAGVTDSTDFPSSTQTVAGGISINLGGNYPDEPSTTFTLNWSGSNASSSGGSISEQFNEPFYLVGFDDSGFSLGQAPFTNTPGALAGTCPFIGKTYFPTLGTLDLRKTVTLPPGAANIQALVAIDNDFTLWVNGTEVINQDHDQRN